MCRGKEQASGSFVFAGTSACAELEKQKQHIIGFVKTAEINLRFESDRRGLDKIYGVVLKILGMPSDAGKKLLYFRVSVSGMRQMHRDHGGRSCSRSYVHYF